MRNSLKSEVPKEIPDFRPGVEIPEMFKYRIESTGAMLTIFNSMDVIQQYCYSLPRDKYFVPNPEYLVAEGPAGFASELHMPRNVRKDCLYLRGTLQPSVALAKREVAFRMAKLLHTLGELNDHLRSVNVKLDEKTGKNIRLPSSKPLFLQRQVLKHHVSVPSHFKGRWDSKTPYFLNVIRMWNDSVDETLVVGFLSVKNLSFATESFEICMDTIPYKVQIRSYPQSVFFESWQLDSIKVFHFEFFRAVLRSKLDEKMNWVTLCIPLITDYGLGVEADPTDLIDWEAIDFAGRVNRSDLSMFGDGRVPFENISDIVLFDKRRYSRSHILLELLPDNNPTNIIEPAMARKYQTVENVYRKRLQYDGPIDLEQFVIRAKPIGYPYRCKILETDLPEAILIPQLCTINPVKYRHLKEAKKFPLLMQYIYHRLLMEDLITGTTFPNYVDAFRANINLMQVAFTAPAAQLNYDYERLETLGDSFLKAHLTLHLFVMYPFRNEGFLTQCRADMENNRNLRKHANRHNLEGFILMDVLVRNTYVPPTLDATPQQEISEKGVADVVEASIAACYLTGGESAASKCIAFFLGEPLKPNWNSYYLHWCTHTLPRNMLEPSMISACKLVEKRIGYEFKNISLLAEALTHTSAISNSGVNSYERIEFLGDAILGIVITDFVFQLKPELNPGKISELRTELYHNQFLASVSSKLGLPKFMSHMSVALGEVHEKWITAFTEKLAETDKLIQKQDDILDPSILMFWNYLEVAPKTLGDLYEALVGAVFLDSGFNIDPVRKIIHSTLIDVWWPRFEPLVNGTEGLSMKYLPNILANIVKQNQCTEFIVTTHPLQEGYLCEYSIHEKVIVSVFLETKKETKRKATQDAIAYLEANPDIFSELCTCEKLLEEEVYESEEESEAEDAGILSNDPIQLPLPNESQCEPVEVMKSNEDIHQELFSRDIGPEVPALASDPIQLPLPNETQSDPTEMMKSNEDIHQETPSRDTGPVVPALANDPIQLPLPNETTSAE